MKSPQTQSSSRSSSRAPARAGSGADDNVPAARRAAPGRTYWWRVRAEDGANIGEYSKPISFVAVAPVTPGCADGRVTHRDHVTDLTPEFRVRAGSKTGPHDRISYMLQVANNSAFSSIAATFVVDEAGSETVIARNYSFLNGRTYLLARAVPGIPAIAGALSAWSGVQTFRSTSPCRHRRRPARHPAAEEEALAPGGPPGDWRICGSTPGREIVECVRDAVYRRSTTENAFDITKRVAWLLRGRGYGLLLKPGGENIITWRGKSCLDQPHHAAEWEDREGAVRCRSGWFKRCVLARVLRHATTSSASSRRIATSPAMQPEW